MSAMGRSGSSGQEQTVRFQEVSETAEPMADSGRSASLVPLRWDLWPQEAQQVCQLWTKRRPGRVSTIPRLPKPLRTASRT
jgi:hypothetical protein